MNVLALIEQPGNVCCRYRIDAYAPELTKRGHRLQAISLREGGRLRFLLYHAVADADLVILQRKLLPSWPRALSTTLTTPSSSAIAFKPRDPRASGDSGDFWPPFGRPTP